MVHISEEAKNSNTAIPYGIVFATLSSVVLGWGQCYTLFVTRFTCIQRYSKGVMVALAFCMGTDLQNIVDNPIGQPMATVER